MGYLDRLRMFMHCTLKNFRLYEQSFCLHRESISLYGKRLCSYILYTEYSYRLYIELVQFIYCTEWAHDYALNKTLCSPNVLDSKIGQNYLWIKIKIQQNDFWIETKKQQDNFQVDMIRISGWVVPFFKIMLF